VVAAAAGVVGGAPPATVEIEYSCAKTAAPKNHTNPAPRSFPSGFNMYA
jgi:hypothetical protein